MADDGTKTDDTAGQGAADTAAADQAADQIAAAAQAAGKDGGADEGAAGGKGEQGQGDKDGQRPEVPESYALTVPDGSGLAAEDLTAIAAEAKTLKATQAQAEFLVQVRAQDAAAAAAALQDSDRVLRADASLGGAHYETSKALANKGLSHVARAARLTDDEVAHMRAFFSGPDGNHTGFVRFFKWLGQAVSEDRPAGGGRPAPERQPDAVLRNTYPTMFAGAGKE